MKPFLPSSPRRQMKNWFRNDPLRSIASAIAIVAAAGTFIVAVVAKAQAVTDNTLAIKVLNERATVNDAVVVEVKHTLEALTYLSCAQAKRDGEIELPRLCVTVLANTASVVVK